MTYRQKMSSGILVRRVYYNCDLYIIGYSKHEISPVSVSSKAIDYRPLTIDRG